LTCLAEAVRGVGGARLKLDVFLAEKDNMIGDTGTKGNRWFEACWRDVGGVEFASETVKGPDHGCVWDLRWDVMERVFRTMRRERRKMVLSAGCVFDKPCRYHI
jgi:hypothetical protein